MTSKQNITDKRGPYPGFTMTLPEQERPFESGGCYSPPRNVHMYASRALPPPPSLASRSSSPSTLGSEAGNLRWNRPRRPLVSSYSTHNDTDTTTLGGAMYQEPSAMVLPLQLAIPYGSGSYAQQWTGSSQLPVPGFKPIARWANGDERVSPITTDPSGTESLKSYAVSPLSERQERGSMDEESWFDDNMSDETRSLDSDGPMEKVQKVNFRYSDPGTPTSFGFGFGFGFSAGELDKPRPGVGGSQQLGGAHRGQTHKHTHSIDDDDYSRRQDKNVSTEDPKVVPSVPKFNTFPSLRPAVGQKPVPHPFRVVDRAVTEDYVKTMSSSRPGSSASHTDVFGSGELSPRQQKRRSGLGSFGASFRSATQKIYRPPPGFTEVISVLDYQGARASPVPRVKNMLSKAKQGLGIGAERL
ncbi:hypothetical protein GGR50DRAFT_642586 [Xylaria sp. CBS 124048]|nr:hypothetical protein GGR50DRAFT_642586 [Xylaria sp. CBS 124048]